MVDKLHLSDEEWRRRLSPEEYRVLRQHGTEPPWEGCFLGTKEPGTYVCAGCGNPLFKSGEKFESGTGWPSFTKPISEDAVDRARGPLLRHDPHRGALRPLRWPSGPRLSRWPAADRLALLHEFGRHEACAGG